MRERSPDDSAVDISWLDRPWAALRRGEALREQVHRRQPWPAEIPAEPPRPTISDRVCSEAAPSAPAIDGVCELAPDRTIAERYPLLRNAL
jgi:hypothetical protein